MNIQIKIQTLLLLIVTCMQCMEPEVLTLNSRVIRTFIKVNTENRFYIPGFSRQRDRILLLQQLADQGAHITFSSTDTEIPSWLDKDIDATQKTLYKLFSFLRHNKNTTQVAVQHNFSEQSKKSVHTLYFNNNSLQITIKKTIKNNTQQLISDLLNEYEYKSKITTTTQPDPNKDTINAWRTYLQLIKNEIESIKPVKPFPSMGSICRDQGIFKLSTPLIDKLVDITKETTDIKTTHCRRRLKKLKLLDQLVKEKVDITFNNEDLTCLIKDAEEFKKTFYSTFFLLLDYDNSTCQAATHNTSLHKRTGFMATISLNNSLLHMVSSKYLPSKIEQRLTEFLQTYQSPIHVKQIEQPQKNLTIEGEIVELNGFELERIILRHKESKIVQKLQTLSEEYKIRQELKMFINDHI